MTFLFCSQFGFSLGRTLIDAINPYVHNHLDGCLLQNVSNLKTEQKDDSSIIYFTMDLKNLTYVLRHAVATWQATLEVRNSISML